MLSYFSDSDCATPLNTTAAAVVASDCTTSSVNATTPLLGFPLLNLHAAIGCTAASSTPRVGNHKQRKDRAGSTAVAAVEQLCGDVGFGQRCAAVCFGETMGACQAAQAMFTAPVLSLGEALIREKFRPIRPGRW